MTTTLPDAASNRLAGETSPYLLQHAHNPVDWYPWGEEALARAAAEDRPILLSVGYSACHWCHVMAHESFEDPDTAALMNSNFINIKVDREERPDLDAIYMEAVQAMTGRGGWPMTVFLTPDGRPFYGGTYFPPEPRHGMPSFRQLLRAIADAWEERRREMLSAGDRMAEALGRSATLLPAGRALEDRLLAHAEEGLLKTHDRYEGGFGGAPKFPQPMNLDFLLQRHRHTGRSESLTAVTLTLDKMAGGGIYDQLGGGFHRYSTDDVWLVPHFEKMLYDNAQLARTYLHAWQVTGDARYRRVVEETLDYVLREMVAPEGGFRSSQDADSEGEEGKFFLWRLEEVLELLDPEEGRLFTGYYGVTARGNFREGGPGANILHARRGPDVAAQDLGVDAARLEDVLARGRATLRRAREARPKPGLDDKVLAEWNGLMIRSLAEAGAALEREDYLAAATKGAVFADRTLLRDGPDGTRLWRTYRNGRAHVEAYLEDYAALGLGLLALHAATGESRWLARAIAMAEAIQARFSDRDRPGYFQTGADHEQLVVRRKDFVDSAVPSGNSLAAELFLLLGRLVGRDDLRERAESIMEVMADGMAEQPGAFGLMLGVLDGMLHPGPEIAVVGRAGDPTTGALLRVIYGRYLPGAVLARWEPDQPVPGPLTALLQGRTSAGGGPAAYVCRDFVCALPVREPDALAALLDQPA
jgi:uncharacterized protein YyaL (SSP411 family)